MIRFFKPDIPHHLSRKLKSKPRFVQTFNKKQETKKTCSFKVQILQDSLADPLLKTNKDEYMWVQ